MKKFSEKKSSPCPAVIGFYSALDIFRNKRRGPFPASRGSFPVNRREPLLAGKGGLV